MDGTYIRMGKGLSMGNKLQLHKNKKVWDIVAQCLRIEKNYVLYISKSQKKGFL
jgi:hypothetical protein